MDLTLKSESGLNLIPPDSAPETLSVETLLTSLESNSKLPSMLDQYIIYIELFSAIKKEENFIMAHVF